MFKLLVFDGLGVSKVRKKRVKRVKLYRPEALLDLLVFEKPGGEEEAWRAVVDGWRVVVVKLGEGGATILTCQ